MSEQESTIEEAIEETDVKEIVEQVVGHTRSMDDAGKTITEDITEEVKPEEVPEPEVAIVDDDTVICRGEAYGGVTTMKRSEYLEIQNQTTLDEETGEE